jgi:hypothetical protein
MWFNDEDPVSVHTLAFAAYEIIHVVSKARGRSRDLLFDTAIIKDQFRSEWNIAMKRSANFFKHAKKERDVEAYIDFAPEVSELFIIVRHSRPIIRQRGTGSH